MTSSRGDRLGMAAAGGVLAALLNGTPLLGATASPQASAPPAPQATPRRESPPPKASTSPRKGSEVAIQEQDAPPVVAPGPEHAVLKQAEGVWDARVEIRGGGPPMVSRGVETNRLAMGGLWLISDFKGEMGEQPFEGHGLYGYDPAKKKYVGVWIDSTQYTFWPSEGDYDAATRTLTMWMEAPDAQGHLVRWKTVTRTVDPDTRVFDMYPPEAEGNDSPGMTITYKRRK
jgi:Protein of unknown function (DUF1579)